jgi:hypothetical protein
MRTARRSVRARRGLAVAAALVVLCVSGCSGGVASPAPSSSIGSTTSTDPAFAAPVLDLIPHIWRVRDAAGESADTWLILGSDVDLIRPKGDVFLSWRTQSDAMLTHVDGWSMSLGRGEPTVPWLTRTTRFSRDGEGWMLTDADGRRTATLVIGGTPPPSKQSLHEVPTVDTTIRKQLADAVPGPQVTAIDPAAVVGTWDLPGIATTDASIRFTAKGGWTAKTTCEVLGTSDGGGGAYRALPSGMLLVTEGAVGGTGCATPEHVPPSDATAITRFFDAGSITVSREHLTVYDRTGKRLGTLTRTS